MACTPHCTLDPLRMCRRLLHKRWRTQARGLAVLTTFFVSWVLLPSMHQPWQRLRSRTDASADYNVRGWRCARCSPGAALQAPLQRRGSLPEAGVADDLLNWSATLQTGSPV